MKRRVRGRTELRTAVWADDVWRDEASGGGMRESAMVATTSRPQRRKRLADRGQSVTSASVRAVGVAGPAGEARSGTICRN